MMEAQFKVDSSDITEKVGELAQHFEAFSATAKQAAEAILGLRHSIRNLSGALRRKRLSKGWRRHIRREK